MMDPKDEKALIIVVASVGLLPDYAVLHIMAETKAFYLAF